MKPSMSKTFKPDPMLSAQAAQRIMKKADQQQANNPGQATDGKGSSKAMKAVSTALETASYLPVGLKARLALTAASMATGKLADSNLMSGQGDMKAQATEMLQSGPGKNDSLSPVALTRTGNEQMESVMQAQRAAADISKSVPASAQADILQQQLQDRLQHEESMGPRPV